MKTTTSLYTSPLSEETKIIRRNNLFASSVCIFIGMTNELPTSFALWGATFTPEQQTTVGWLLLSVTAYLFIHFLSLASIEVAKWIQPFYEHSVTKKELMHLPNYNHDVTDWVGILGAADKDVDAAVVEEIKENSRSHVENRLKYFYKFVYLRLFIEVIFPIIISLSGLYLMLPLIL